MGTYNHPPSNISNNDQKITAKSDLNKLKVGKTAKIKKVKTFHDLMKSTEGIENKKAAILDIFRNKPNFMHDQEFNFYFCEGEGVCLLMFQDLKFYVNSMKILFDKIDFNRAIYYIAFGQRKKLLEGEEFKNDR